ncbi:MAG: YbhB/YbcL family Raf kinase inhibitor-like protein [Vulcanimicrobiota bacterium]
MNRKLLVILFVLLLFFAGCQGKGPENEMTKTAKSDYTGLPAEGEPGKEDFMKNNFTISSQAFSDGAEIPVEYAASHKGGNNISPPLNWKNPPDRTNAFVLVMTDPDANGFLHWCVVNIPGDIRSLARNASEEGLPGSAFELENDYGDMGYGGPGPPNEHEYVINIYALSEGLTGVDENSTLEDVETEMKGKIVEKAQYSGVFTPSRTTTTVP